MVKFQTWHFGLAKRKAGLSKHRQPQGESSPNHVQKHRLRFIGRLDHLVHHGAENRTKPESACAAPADVPKLLLKTCHTSTMCWGKYHWTKMTKNILLFKYRYTLCTPRIVTKSHTNKKLELYYHKQTYIIYIIILKNIIQTAHVSKMLFSFLCHACLAQAVSVATLDKCFKAPLDRNGY